MYHYRNTSLENIVEEIDGIVYTEEWVPFIGFETSHHMSSFGRVKRLAKTLKSGKNIPDIIRLASAGTKKKKYLKITVSSGGIKKGESIHRLVGLHFIPPVEGKPHINHKTGDKFKNHYTQLEWCTPQENNEHGVKMGLLKRGVNKKPYIRKGRKHQFKPVKNIDTCEVFSSLHEVAAKEGYSKSYFGKQLRGDRLNTTPYRYKESSDDFIRKPYKEKEKTPIAVFDMWWNFVKAFDYKKEAALFIGHSNASGINEFLNGMCSHVKGFKFKSIDNNGDYIEPIPFIPYVRPPKKVKIKQPVTPSKEVIKYDSGGNELTRFGSIGLAAKDCNTEKKLFGRAIKKSPRGFYKGFIYKIA
jgi:hypothetical protein